MSQEINVLHECIKSCYKHKWSLSRIAARYDLTIAEVVEILGI